MNGGVDSPTSPSLDRIQALDVLRGVAVAGILFANVLVFFGIFFLPPERAAAFPTAAADSVARFLERAFIEAKFYSIFSLLFGIGFGLQLSKGENAALPRFRRRLKILLAIGAIHAFLIWSGDILMLYALLGFMMPWFARKTDRELLRWTVIVLAVPTALYLVGLAVWTLVGPAPAATPSAPTIPPQFLVIFERMGTGGATDALKGNLMFLAGRWADLFATVRFPKVLGMFVLGLWAARTGIALDPSAHRSLLVRWSRLGLSVGLPLNLAAAWAFGEWPYLPPSVGGLLGVVMPAVGVPMLALGYAATIGLLVVDGWRFIRVMAPVGRMALTNYLMHSIICVVLSYGYGFGLWWRVGAAKAMVVALAIIVIQIPLSAWWLSRYRFGPVEWIWRRLTYARPL
jgi:uncharacterized protein